MEVDTGGVGESTICSHRHGSLARTRFDAPDIIDARNPIIAGHTARKPRIFIGGKAVWQRNGHVIAGEISDRQQRRAVDASPYADEVVAATSLQVHLRCRQAAGQVDRVVLQSGSDVDARLRLQRAGQRDAAAPHVLAGRARLRRRAVRATLEIPLDIDPAGRNQAGTRFDRQVIAGKQAHEGFRALDRDPGHHYQVVKPTNAVVCDQGYAVGRNDAAAHGQRAHRRQGDGTCGHQRASWSGIHGVDLHRAGVDDPGAALDRLALQHAHFGLQGRVRRADVVAGKQLQLARFDIAAAGPAIENATGRRGNEGRIGKPHAHLVQQQIASDLDQIGSQRTGSGQRAGTARGRTVDVDTVVRAADGTEICAQHDVACDDVNARTRGQSAGIAGRCGSVQDREVGTQLHVAIGRCDAVQPHVAQHLPQIDTAAGRCFDRPLGAEIGFQRIRGAADAAGGAQFDALAGNPGRVAAQRVENRTGARRQAHRSGLRRCAFEQHVADGLGDVQVVEGAHSQRRVRCQVQQERLVGAPDGALPGFQDQAAAHHVDPCASERIDDAGLALDPNIGRGSHLADAQLQARITGAQVGAGPGADIDPARGIHIDVVALRHHDGSDGHALRGAIPFGREHRADRNFRCQLVAAHQSHARLGDAGDRVIGRPEAGI